MPWPEKGDYGIMFAVGVDGQIPLRPENTLPSNSHDANVLWTLLVDCWAYAPKDRPSAEDVIKVVSSTRPLDFGAK